MVARRTKRMRVNIKANMIAGDKRHASFIENLSEGGVLITAAAKDATEFPPDTPIELEFQFHNGNIHHLNCRVRWSHMTPPHGLTKSIGMEIISAPEYFREALRTLS
jgi:hypothetical protein